MKINLPSHTHIYLSICNTDLFLKITPLNEKALNENNFFPLVLMGKNYDLFHFNPKYSIFTEEKKHVR